MGKLDRRRLDIYAPNHRECLIETGTAGGHNLADCAELFQQVHTIELDRDLFEQSKRRLRGHKNVSCYCGDSCDLLPRVIDQGRQTVFWLDAHYSPTIGNPRPAVECPVIQELAIILFNFRWRVPPIILIDDAKMFGDKYWTRDLAAQFDRSKWPTLDAIRDLAKVAGYSVRLKRKLDLVIVTKQQVGV